MNKQLIGRVKLKYDADGDLQMGNFKPMIEITKDQVKSSGINNCTNKSAEEIKECARLLLASFFSKVSEIELRDVEKTTIETNIVSSTQSATGLLEEVEIAFVYVS